MATIKKACKGVSYPKSSNVSSRLGSVKKAQKGTSLGMKSVKAGFDKNPGVTRADIIVAAKKKAQKGIKVKKAQTGRSQGRNPNNIDYELNAPLQKGTNRDRNLTNTTRQDMLKMRMLNKERNSFIGPLTRFGNETAEDDRYEKYKGPKWDETPRGRVDRQYKKGGSVKKSASKKMTMKTGGKMKKCAYGCK